MMKMPSTLETMENIRPNLEDGEQFLPADLLLEINASSGAPNKVNVNERSSRPRRASSSSNSLQKVPPPLRECDKFIGAETNVKPNIGIGFPSVDYCFYCPPWISGPPFVSGPPLPFCPRTPTLQKQGFKKNRNPVLVTGIPQGTGVFLPAGNGKPLSRKEAGPNKGSGKENY